MQMAGAIKAISTTIQPVEKKTIFLTSSNTHKKKMQMVIRQCSVKNLSLGKIKNIAGTLPQNSRNSFVDMQSKKSKKKTDQKNRLFIEGWRCYI